MKPVSNTYLLITVFSFILTLLISAVLMFTLQPLFGKLLLPALGGSPAVWNTCMVFYQTVVFLGYLYAHGLNLIVNRWQQFIIHSSLLILSLYFLPVTLPEILIPPTNSQPILWLIKILATSIGLPFLIISTTSPLLQAWFTKIGHHRSTDPYYLSIASNSGSLLALMSYPFLIEPHLGLTDQRFIWSTSYAVYIGFVLVCAGFFIKQPFKKSTTIHSEILLPESPSKITMIHWGLLAFVPSSLLLGVTNFISTDIAAVPLLWIIPLILYLFSFILVFSAFYPKIQPIIIHGQPLFILIFMIMAFINPAELNYWIYLALHTIGFLISALICHGELARLRPHAAYLTRYYLIMSFAGMLGGIFNSLIAPFIFTNVTEYPLMIIAALLLRPNRYTIQWQSLLSLIPGILLIIVGKIAQQLIPNLVDYFDPLAWGLIGLTLVSYFFYRYLFIYAGLIAAILFLALDLQALSAHTVFQQRSFFGVSSIRSAMIENEKHQPEMIYELFHGTTKHGAQRLAKNLQTIPTLYYSPQAPMGQLFKEFASQNTQWHIGIVGLGAGALLCYRQPQQQWTIFEIDPLVFQIAADQHYFHYLSSCGQKAQQIIGDARLSIAAKPNQSFDLLIMDAFSSDAVPTHLLTQQAISLYLSHLKPNGLLAFHISNRHLDLKKVLSDHAEHFKLAALRQAYQAKQPAPPLVVDAEWVVMAKNPQLLQRLVESRYGHWEKLPLYFDFKSWSDDFTSIIDIWKTHD
ncbi:MAG: hypothetical protein RL637_1528 [Pseudomonadota bacterium]|jgi:hypothetical protein